MFDYDISAKKHFTGKDGEGAYKDWCAKMRIATINFPFRVKTGEFDGRGIPIWLNVVSWGFYQGSDWSYYVFISYRSGQGRYTCAYHWNVDGDGLPCGEPLKHEWRS